MVSLHLHVSDMDRAEDISPHDKVKKLAMEQPPGDLLWGSHAPDGQCLNEFDFPFANQNFYMPEFDSQDQPFSTQPTLDATPAEELLPASTFASTPTLNPTEDQRNANRLTSGSNGPASGTSARQSSRNATSNSHNGPRVTIEDHDVSAIGHAKTAQSALGGSSKERKGIGPRSRNRLNDVEIVSPNEQERQRQLSEDRNRVQDWLDRWSSTSREEPALEHGRGADEIALANTSTPSAGVLAKNPPQPQLPEAPGPGLLLDIDEDENDPGSSDNISEHETTTSLPARVEDLGSGERSEPAQAAGQEDALPRKVRPWTDSPVDENASNAKGQPYSSNEAISRFLERARDTETASMAATLGSRRRSESDVGSLFSADAISRAPTIQNQRCDKVESRSGLLERMIPRHNSSNPRKRKDEPLRQSQGSVTADQKKEQRGSPSSGFVGTLSKPRSPRIDTNVDQLPRHGALSPTHLSYLTANSPLDRAKTMLRRARSKSELGRKSLGLVDIWAQQGGPPALKPPGVETHADSSAEALSRNFDAPDDDEVAPVDDISPPTTVAMTLNIREVPTEPTREGFRDHVVRLNNRLKPFMVERTSQEQLLRYRRLLEHRLQHKRLVSRGNCPSGDRCSVLGKGPYYPALQSSGRGKDALPFAFQVSQNDSQSDTREAYDNASVAPALFPEGIPNPPVERLPAEFECPLCFQVKKFQKPSDWTKHVHEDVQPFTCTFPNCGDPKSFKRKADWVRHETERHRHLEKWICNHGECRHECYRKDNFVQHLVREHKYAEPRVRSTKAASKGFPAGTEENEIVSALVDGCHHETARKPSEEPCRFCGNLCSTWKKLTVHLGKHMEQISLPILTLLDEQRPEEAAKGSFRGGGSNGVSPAPSAMSGELHSATRSPYSDQGKSLEDQLANRFPLTASTLAAGSTYPPASIPNLNIGMHTQAYNPGAIAMVSNANGAYSDPSLYASSGASTPHNAYDAQSQTSRGASPYTANAPSFPSNSLHPHQNTGLHLTPPSGASNPSAWANPHQSRLGVQAPAQNTTTPAWQDQVVSTSPTEVGSFTGFPASTFEESVGALSLDQGGGWSQPPQFYGADATAGGASFAPHQASLQPAQHHFSNAAASAAAAPAMRATSPAEYFGGQHNATFPGYGGRGAHGGQRGQQQQQQQYEFY